jgi:hypothetical protein
LTPEDLFRHRLAALLGRPLAEIDELSDREYRSWLRYWAEEPWGPYRDNMHAAMLAVQILRPHVREGKKAPALEDFMFKPPEDPEIVRKRNALTFLAMLKSSAKKRRTP